MSVYHTSQVITGEAAKTVEYIQTNGEPATLDTFGFLESLTVTDFGIVGVSRSHNSKILIPWNRIANVWF